MDVEIFQQDKIGFERLTDNAKRTVNQAYSVARSYYHKDFLIIHIFLSLLENKKGIVEELVNKLSIDEKTTIERIRIELSKMNTTNSADPTKLPAFSEEVKQLIQESYLVASDLNQVFVGTEHLFLAMFRIPGLKFIQDMQKAGINYTSLRKILESLGNYSMLESGVQDGKIKGGGEELPYFVRDMNKLAEEGRYPDITGREEEIKRLVHILSRKTKNNPILVGDAGVGKTAIVEGFVNKLVDRDLPASLLSKRILSLDVAAVVAGAKLRGDVEERINYLINKIADDGNIILFIDEIHNIIGAGSVGGRDNMDIANILKPYLTSSELTVIGATTTDEYSKYFEEDSALNRRFQPVAVNELDIESATHVLTNMKKEFEYYHKVKINNDAIKNAVTLSSKFIKDRYLPDKAIDLLDEACAAVKIGREIAIEPALSKLGEKLIKVQEEKQKAMTQKSLDKASKLRLQEEKVIEEIEQVVEGKIPVQKRYQKTVTEDLIKQIIVDWTQIPIAASDISNKTLKNLETRLKNRIIGQDHVVKNVTEAIQRSHLGLGEDKRPLGSFLFLGPTGVGKTELAKVLAKELFGSEDLIFQLDMSEMMEMHSVSKLIGAPPGYVGYQEGGQLTKHVKRKPYSVILFDEIEKAHPDTLNLLLQILDEGHLTDAKGVKVSFNNCIVIMTSNIGAEDVSSDKKLGFDVYFDDKEKKILDKAYTDMKDSIINRLRKSLRPEFINRIDLIDVFRGLNKEDSYEISKNNVNYLKLRLIDNGIILNVTEKVINHINEIGYSKEYGGRNIRRKVQEVLENGLAQFLLEQDIPTKRKQMLKVNADFVKDKVVFKMGR